MKKIMLCLFTIAVFGQTAIAQKVKFGIQGGLNLANAQLEQSGTGNVDYDADLRTAFNGGIYAQFGFLKEKLFIQPGIMYSAEGFVNMVDRTAGQDEEVNTNLNFMNVPITFVYKPVKFLNIQFGPEFGYLLQAVADGEKVTDVFNRSELGLNLGIGTTLAGFLDVTVRYNRGLTKTYDGSQEEFVGDDPSLISNGNVTASSKMFQVSLGLNISNLMNKGSN